jgi:predicted Fe-Mo cluster-binding NifX family protein
MKICISATGSIGSHGNNPERLLDAQVDPRFGRCPFFVIVDTEGMKLEALLNRSSQAMHGAGIFAAQDVVNRGVQTVITGSVGPKAYQVLAAAGIRVITGAGGTVRQVIESYKKGKLQASSTVPGFPPYPGRGSGEGLTYEGSGTPRGAAIRPMTRAKLHGCSQGRGIRKKTVTIHQNHSTPHRRRMSWLLSRNAEANSEMNWRVLKQG